MQIVVDASVVVKWFVEEKNSEKALKLRDKYIDGVVEILAPELIIFEILNALQYKALFTESEVKEISKAIESYGFKLYSLKGEYAKKAVEVAFENEITLYDSSYIALAVLQNSQFFTADEELIKKLNEKYNKIVKHFKEFK